MKLFQLEYFIKIAEVGSINEAAKQLFVSQPNLSKAMKELEKNYHIQLFVRNKTGITLTDDGREFMNYAKQVLDQCNLLEERFTKKAIRKSEFSVSAQHYAFVVHAFVELINSINTPEYHYVLRETQTATVIQDVATLKSEIGVIYTNAFNQEVIMKIINENNLEFIPLFQALPHVFIGRDNPLAQKKTITLDDLSCYPFLSYEQGENNSFYYSEEILSTMIHKKHIQITDRATIFNLMVGLNGYTISSGIISSELNDDKIVARPLEVDDFMILGIIKHQKHPLSEAAEHYLSLLKEHIKKYDFDVFGE